MEKGEGKLARRIKSLREAKGLTQKELSKLTGVAASMISMIECGNIKKPKLWMLYNMHPHLHVGFFELGLLSGYTQEEISEHLSLTLKGDE